MLIQAADVPFASGPFRQRPILPALLFGFEWLAFTRVCNVRTPNQPMRAWWSRQVAVGNGG